MKKKLFGFTLAELLIALSIIGVVAVLTIPTLLNNINKKTMAAQLKSFVADVQQLATERMVEDRTNYLEETAFRNATTLAPFFDTAEICTDTACGVSAYRNINNNSTISPVANAKLKNGAIVGYRQVTSGASLGGNDYLIGRVYIDVNGVDEPNMVGRDYFSFFISSNGKIYGVTSATTNNSALEANCKSGSSEQCFELIMRNSWNMTY